MDRETFISHLLLLGFIRPSTYAFYRQYDMETYVMTIPTWPYPLTGNRGPATVDVVIRTPTSIKIQLPFTPPVKYDSFKDALEAIKGLVDG